MGIRASVFSDEALNQIVEVIRPIIYEKEREIKQIRNVIKELEDWLKDNVDTIERAIRIDRIVKEKYDERLVAYYQTLNKLDELMEGE